VGLVDIFFFDSRLYMFREETMLDLLQLRTGKSEMWAHPHSTQSDILIECMKYHHRNRRSKSIKRLVKIRTQDQGNIRVVLIGESVSSGKYSAFLEVNVSVADLSQGTPSKALGIMCEFLHSLSAVLYTTHPLSRFATTLRASLSD